MAWRIPPHGVGGELVALGVVELLDGPDQAEVALLHHVEERKTSVGVLLRHRHDQPQVSLQHVGLGAPAVLGHRLQIPPEVLAQARLGVQLVLSEQAGLDPLSQIDFLLGGEQASPADRLEVRVHRVAHGRRLVVEVDLGQRRRLGFDGPIVGHCHCLCLCGAIGLLGTIAPSGSGTVCSDLCHAGLGAAGLGRAGAGRRGLLRALGLGGLLALIGQAHACIGKLAQDGTSLGRGNTRPLEGGPKLGEGQVTLAAPSLDQVVHARSAYLTVPDRCGDCGPRHATPPSFSS